MSEITASTFPELMPKNETLVAPRVGVTSTVYDGEILVPSTWRGRT
jgi:hypothetical protein